jgi:Zn-dependent peptidase ImmA (M78 family)
MSQPESATSARRRPALAAIAELAESINEAFGADGAIDPVQLIEDNPELTWSHGDYGDRLDGLIRFTGRRFHIFLNANRCRRIRCGRGAFTLGHELGHYCIDAHNNWLRGRPDWMHVSHIDDEASERVPYEHDANIFATSLLMPNVPFRRRARSLPMGRDAITALSDHFGMSQTAVARRCAELEVWPCAFIAWDLQGHRRRAYCSPKVLDEYGWPTRSLDELRSESLTARVLRGEAIPGKAITTAEQWFPRIDHAQQRKGFPLERLLVQIDEYVIPQGEWGYLTMLCGNSWYGLRAAR